MMRGADIAVSVRFVEVAPAAQTQGESRCDRIRAEIYKMLLEGGERTKKPAPANRAGEGCDFELWGSRKSQ